MKMLIDGEWVETGKWIEVRNPYDNSLIDRVPEGTREDVNKAIHASQSGLIKMAKVSGYERYEMLQGAAELIQEKLEDFARTISLESGKTIREARGEVGRAVQTFLLSAEEAKRIHGETIPFDGAPGAGTKLGFYIRVPVGVIAAISPFNFPLNLVAHKVAPALAGGNSVILKPATKTPLTALKLGEAIMKAGLPRGALNIVTGRGESVGDPLVQDERVRMVTFTGSLDVGRGIMAKVGLKKATMELGSNSAVIVIQDADLDQAVPKIVRGGYALAGQVCISVQRVYVQEGIAEAFLGRLVEKVKALRMGNPLDETTDLGPMISEEAARRCEDWIQEARALGGKILYGGGRQGAFITPCVLSDVPRDAKVVREEAFAPLVVVNRFSRFEEAVEAVNDSKYGLQGSIFTRDLKTALEAARRLEVGGIMVNEVPTFRADLMPYGGVKGSGLGREGPRFAIEEMTEIRAVGIEMGD